MVPAGDPVRSSGTVGRFAAALFGWVVGGLAAPVGATVLLAYVVDALCGDRTDCSWGFELVLVVPVLLVCFFVMGPLLVGELLAKEAGMWARRRATRATLLGALLSVVAMWIGSGSGWRGVAVALVLSAVGVPALVTWRTRRRPQPG